MDGMPDITLKEFNFFRKLIHSQAGVHMNDSKMSLVRGRLMRRIRHFGLRTYMDYYDFLQQDGPESVEEMHILIDLLTTHETFFFRESEHYRFLKNYLLEHKGKLSEFRLWIAAASSGEEAYSAAMVIDDVLGNSIPWEIPATDISRGVIEVAKTGLYPIEKAEHIPEDYLRRYCKKGIRTMEGLFTIEPELKRRIQFKKMNLMDDLKIPGLFDMIFLRNVMIYFDMETKQQLVYRITEKIKPGGFLITGHSESVSLYKGMLKWHHQSIYRKNE